MSHNYPPESTSLLKSNKIKNIIYDTIYDAFFDQRDFTYSKL